MTHCDDDKHPAKRTVKVLGEIGHPNRNGTIYTQEAILAAIEDANKRIKERGFPMLGGVGNTPVLDIMQACLTAENFRIEGNSVVADVELLPKSPVFEALSKSIDDSFAFHTVGVGSIVDNEVQPDFRIAYVSLSPKDGLNT